MLKKLFGNKLKGDFYKNVLTLFTGRIISHLIPFIVYPVLTRLYTPEEFGVFALFSSICIILSIIATGNYELSVMLPEEDKDAFNLVILSIFFNLVFSLILTGILFLTEDYLSLLFEGANARLVIFLIPASVFFQGIIRTLGNWKNRKKKYKMISASFITNSGVTTGLQTYLGFMDHGPSGLIGSAVAGQGAAAGILSAGSFRDYLAMKKYINLKKITELTKRYIKFPKYNLFSQLLNNISIQIPVFLLTALFKKSMNIVGSYSIPHRILSVPVTMIGSSISQVYFQTASENRKDKNALNTITFDILKKLLLIGVIPFSFVIVYGDIIFTFVYGSEWEIAGHFAQIISPWLLFVFIASPLSPIFTVLEKQQLSLLFNIVLFSLRLSSLLVGGLIFKDAYITITLFSATGLLFWIFYTFFILKLANVNILKASVFIFSVLGVAIIPVILSRFLLNI